MNKYTILYRDSSLLPADPPLIFQCDADDGDHAEEQCDNAYPGCEAVWIVETADVDAAYDDYWGSSPSSSDNAKNT